MVHPAITAITFGIALGGAIFALFYYGRQENNQYRYEDRPRRHPLEYMQRQFETDICSICLDRFDRSDVYLECGHRFHEQCIQSGLQHSNLCPNCRQPAKIRSR